MKKIRLIILLLLFCSMKSSAQNFYALDTIQQIEIFFAQSNWDYLLDTSKQGSDGYTMAQWVKINGVQFDSVGVKYKGNSSYNAANMKNPLHIELDHFKNQDYLGYKDIKLSNGFNDPSCIREVLLYSILQQYTKISSANYAQVYINGQLMGHYTNTESVTNHFLEDRFYSKDNTFVFADNGGCDLRFKGSDSTLYSFPYTLKSDYGLADLMRFCDTLNNNIVGIENNLDVDRTLWMFALTNVFVILDSYLGNSKHNYYIYKDDHGRFNPIIWDLNGGLGVFAKAHNNVSLTTAQMQNMSSLLHQNDSLWPLVNKLLTQPTFKRMYIAHMKTIVQENLDNSSYLAKAQHLQNIIDTIVQSDSNLFFNYSQFQSNLYSTVVTSQKIIPGITELMNVRMNYLNSTPEFMQVAPTLSNIIVSDTFPNVNTTVLIKIEAINANTVYLGVRNTDLDRFYRLPMFDDGLHGDSAAADGIYGIYIPINNSSLQYYFYAENNNAGIFSPARAEHEFYTLHANYASLFPSQVVINEMMALNISSVQNANGGYSDWLELYNTSSSVVSLDYLFLSDNFSNPNKWQFPFGKTIPPFGYFIVWADNDTSSNETHCSFGFSGNGEDIILSYSNGTVIDSTVYPIQTNDITWGRYPNGNGPFVYLSPTFNAVNLISTIQEHSSTQNFNLYPNPSYGNIFVHSTYGETELKVLDVLGNLVFQKRLHQLDESISLNLSSGMYFYQVSLPNKILSGKIMIY
ncbi:MAG: CotH kinase family protein [Bacteroidetes bacterium]|nr:CotH kinase family protein [Bacteroidota bacterium]